MAQVKISELNEDTAPTANDIVPVTDAETNITKKVKISNLSKGMDDVVHKTGDESFSGNKTATGQLDGNIKLNTPQGHMLNGKIVTSVSSGALTVSIKTLSGNDPSSTDPVYVRIGNSIRKVTYPVSKTIAGGINWFNLGSLELQNQEVDLFVYLSWNGTDVGVGWSRIPFARTYSNFSTTNENEKMLVTSHYGALAGTDEVENIGRFNAILSNTNQWLIPATSIIINRPIFETRRLLYNPQAFASGGGFSIGNGSIEGGYSLNVRNVSVFGRFNFGSTTNIGTGQLSFTIPFQNDIGTSGLQLRTLGGGSGAAYNGNSFPLTPVTNYYNNNGGLMLATPNTANSGFLGVSNPFTWAASNYAGWGWSYDMS